MILLKAGSIIFVRPNEQKAAFWRLMFGTACKEKQIKMSEQTISETGYSIKPLDSDTVRHLAEGLNEEEFRILLDHGTEPAFCGTLLDNKLDGTYACRLCGLPLFSSIQKFNSNTGWPSFYAPFDKEHLTYIEDNSYGMRRVEIRCARCGGHQGHVFPDGPPPTGQRYCLNSASLEFFENGEDIPQKPEQPA